MGKWILVFVLFLSFCSLLASEQTIVIKTTGGAEREALNKVGEPYIGYNNINLKQDNKGNVTLNCSDDGWEPCTLDTQSVKLNCSCEDLLKHAFSKIKKGEDKGKFTDKITENKKKFKRTATWTSTGYLKDSEITIKLVDAK